MFVYVIINKKTGDCYVGMTRLSPDIRFKHHKRSARGKSQTYLHRAMRCRGESEFVIEVLEQDCEDIAAREVEWIRALNPSYNMTTGGEGGDTSRSPNFVEAMKNRKIHGVHNPMFGKKGESNPNYGSRRSDSQKTRMQAGLQSAWVGNENRREKARQRITGMDNNPGAQKVAKSVEFEGITYRSLAEASRITGRAIETIKRRGTFL
ncbi:MAG: GIY-YIG nuclease family protein [Proteobacteria bacterium]|nr:MAG: GIY-YIG nuclease family protein [Pseudomonadota bacterium]